MSQASVSASGLVRVTVASGTRRVDLVLPGAVPVAELVPELARSVGLLDAEIDKNENALKVTAVHELVPFDPEESEIVRLELEDLAAWLGVRLDAW